MPSSVPPLAATQVGSIAATVRTLPPGTRPADVWRGAAFALLRLNPKEAEALGVLFEDETVSDDVRMQVLDLLAGAGTFETQVVMRRLLALAIARRNNRQFASFVQRLGIIEHPDGPTLRFLMSVFAESRNEPHDVRAACAYALGASAGNAFLAGDADTAVRACDVLRKELLAAASVPEKCALVTALGNAGLPSDANVIMRFTDDSDASVRAASALALRKIGTKETRSKLISMLADRELKVSQSALVALTDHKLGDEELDQLSELVLGGRTALALDGRILRLVVAQRTVLTPTPSRPGPVENALRLLLGRVDASGPIGGGPGQSGERRLMVGGKAIVQTNPPPAFTQPPPQRQQSVHAFPASTPTPTPPQQDPLPRASQIPTAPPPAPVLPFSGQYRIVQSDLSQLGLDPNGTAECPPPPPKKENLGATVVANPADYREQISRSKAATGGVSPNAIVRRAR
jgi:HEAT repeat protein